MNDRLPSILTVAQRGVLQRWSVVLSIALLCLALASGGEAVRAWARFEREGVEMGQFWRLLSGHFVHLGWSHLAMNLVALLLLGALLERAMTPLEWAGTTLAAAAFIDAGLYWLDSGVQWYVGLSGILHGLLAFGALKLLRQRSGIGVALVVGLAAKLLWERRFGPIGLSEASTGGPVVVAAHLYGAAGGAVWAALLAAIHRRGDRRL